MANNRLTLIQPLDKKYGLYKCVCGKTKRIVMYDVIHNKTLSCGCLRNERIIKHSGTRTKLWYVWNDMRYRCEKSYHHAYKHYGGRGIKVCEEWHDYINFKNWAIKNGYAVGLTIDRTNVNGNYEPNNCQWIPQTEQVKNTRRNLDIDLKKLSTETGIIYGTLLYRYHHNLDLITGGKSNV